MKRTCALLLAFMMLTAGTAFAAQIGEGKIITATDSAGTNPLGTAAFAKLSTGVSLGYATGTGTYAIATKHKNGDKAFGAAANDGKNYFIAANVGDAAATVTVSDSQAFQGWDTL